MTKKTKRKSHINWNKKTFLYISWALLYCACIPLGFVKVQSLGEKAVLMAISILFFLPPFWLYFLAKKENHHKTIKILRWLSIGSLALTLILLIANIASVLGSAVLGRVLYVLLVLVSVPLAASHTWALSLYFWAILMVLTLPKLRRGRK